MADFILEKPIIDSEKILTKEEAVQVETALKRSGVLLINVNAVVAKNDYIDDHSRGTVKWNEKMRNYSFHKVIIPDGTKIKESNFTQAIAHTPAIEGQNLTFTNCNLKNCVIDKSWTVIGCCCGQKDMTFGEDE